MEDAHIASTSLPGLSEWAYFAVLDGHAGKRVAEFSAETLLPTLVDELVPKKANVQVRSTFFTLYGFARRLTQKRPSPLPPQQFSFGVCEVHNQTLECEECVGLHVVNCVRAMGAVSCSGDAGRAATCLSSA